MTANDAETIEYGQTRRAGTGFCFKASGELVWVVRATAREGRYTILTYADPEEGATVYYQIVDWVAKLRGTINVVPGTLSKVTTRLGADRGIEEMVAKLNRPSKEYGVAADNHAALDITEIIMALDLKEEVQAVSTEAVHVGPFPKLNAADRCDRCGAQSYVALRLRGGRRLDFCAHHYSEHGVALLPHVEAILDERENLLVRP